MPLELTFQLSLIKLIKLMNIKNMHKILEVRKKFYRYYNLNYQQT